MLFLQLQRYLRPHFFGTKQYKNQLQKPLLSKLPNLSIQRHNYRLITLQGQNEIESNHDTDVTLYIKGFLAKKSDPEKYQNWLSSHNKLVESRGWGKAAKAFFWTSEKKYVFPAASLTWIGWRLLKLRSIHPVGLLTVALTDLALLGVQVVNDCRNIDKIIAENQSELEEHLTNLHQRYQRVRVVAHSAGCKLIVKTVQNLPFSKRPHYLHLCAPALTEDEVPDWQSLAQISTSIYYCERDTVLKAAHLIVWGGDSLGVVGLKQNYPRVHSINVCQYLDPSFIHSSYDERFHLFATE